MHRFLNEHSHQDRRAFIGRLAVADGVTPALKR